jgi:hypothetical protein
MLGSVVGYFRRNVVGFLALFVALGGTAYAVNTVGSADIIDESIQSADIKNGEVKAPDVAADAVDSARVRDNTINTFDVHSFLGSDVVDGTLTGADIADFSLTEDDVATGTLGGVVIKNDSLLSNDIKDGTLTGADVADNSLTGADIDESTLVPLDADAGFDDTCDPQDPQFADCDASATLTLGRTMPVLITAMTHFGGGQSSGGACRLERNDVAVSDPTIVGTTSSGFQAAGPQFTDVQVLPAGTYTFEVACQQVVGNIFFFHIRISAVELAHG